MTLTNRWNNLWRDLGAGKDSNDILHDLMTRYGEPHRAYHTLTHIEHCLSELDAVLGTFADPRAAKLALWYHDAIYDPTRHDNESASVVLMREHAQRVGFPTTVVDTAGQYVHATAHTSAGSTLEEQTIVDIDLAILGQPEEVFDRYDRAIRAEYHFVPWDEYVVGRTNILQAFLARPTIYATAHFRDRYEAQARQNLARALERLATHS